ncbi:MAG: hypothetical protein ABSA93_18440 [Streptosporangiaceae bacterium]|jgi:hypothetical protein
MTIEVVIPDEWTTGEALAMQQLIQHSMRGAQPVIAVVRKDATPDQLHDIYRKVDDLIDESGLGV